jgi:hypothetical protein
MLDSHYSNPARDKELFRCSLQCHINKNLDFHISDSEDSSENDALLLNESFVLQTATVTPVIAVGRCSLTSTIATSI